MLLDVGDKSGVTIRGDDPEVKIRSQIEHVHPMSSRRRKAMGPEASHATRSRIAEHREPIEQVYLGGNQLVAGLVK
jgi:hypothetical protein